MIRTARDRLAQLLAGDQGAKSDAALLRLPGDALTLTVADIGPVTVPVRAAQAKRLIAVSRPARFGQGEQTLSDASVRDTWELTPEQVTLDADWDEHLGAALTHFQGELGLPADATLHAELHSVLVYGKGQFFVPHQDSEKSDGMIATLVVSLPSVHTGGELVVDDGGTERTYRGSRDDLVLVAFYADRRHEVRPVRSGYRVTVTFNLMISGPTSAAEPGSVEPVARCLTEHFATRATRRYSDRDLGEPSRLVFLLDHEYTEAGLRPKRLKGDDAARVAMLLAAAEQTGCEAVLALAEIKETWAAIPAQPSWGHGGYDDEFDDPDPNDADDDGPYDLDDLIDDEITLGWWISPDGKGAEKISLPLGAHEVCAVTPSRSLTPYHSEYEGYMGNYGNTVDRWYRRAAVVVWPREKSFPARAEAGSAWALRTLLKRIDVGDLDGARSDALALEPFWLQIEPSALALALEVAAGLGDPTAARVVLEPFCLETLAPDHAPLLAAVAGQYGDPWTQDLLAAWDPGQRHVGAERTTWVNATLLPLSRALRESGSTRLADQVGDRVWSWLSGQVDAWVGHAHASERRKILAELGRPLARLLEAVSDDSGATITATLRAANAPVTALLVATLRAHRPPSTAAVATIAGDCRDRLMLLLDTPARDEDDWSIGWTGCGCAECLQLETFLAFRSDQTIDWPLAKPGRQHVHRQIDAAGLPVRHTTRRQGRPFTLRLEKTEALFFQDRDTRRQAKQDLDWVTSVDW